MSSESPLKPKECFEVFNCGNSKELNEALDYLNELKTKKPGVYHVEDNIGGSFSSGLVKLTITYKQFIYTIINQDSSWDEYEHFFPNGNIKSIKKYDEENILITEDKYYKMVDNEGKPIFYSRFKNHLNTNSKLVKLGKYSEIFEMYDCIGKLWHRRHKCGTMVLTTEFQYMSSEPKTIYKSFFKENEDKIIFHSYEGEPALRIVYEDCTEECHYINMGNLESIKYFNDKEQYHRNGDEPAYNIYYENKPGNPIKLEKYVIDNVSRRKDITKPSEISYLPNGCVVCEKYTDEKGKLIEEKYFENDKIVKSITHNETKDQEQIITKIYR